MVADHLLVDQLCTNPKSDRSDVWKWHNVQRARSEMRRCTTHGLYRFKLWRQGHCQHPENANLDCHELQGRAQGDENKVSGYGYGIWCGFKWGPHHATSHLRSRLESQHQSVPGCAQECGEPLVQSGGRWQTLGVAAGPGAGLQVQRDPGLASEGVLRLCTFSHWAPPPPTWTCWTTSFGYTSRTSSTWPPTTPKPAWSPPSAELPPALVEKACSQFRIRIETLKAAILNRCQLYYIIKLPELIFSIKVLK